MSQDNIGKRISYGDQKRIRLTSVDPVSLNAEALDILWHEHDPNETRFKNAREFWSWFSSVTDVEAYAEGGPVNDDLIQQFLKLVQYRARLTEKEREMVDELVKKSLNIGKPEND